MGEGLKRAFAAARATRDDRVCDLGAGCTCVTRGVRGDGWHFDRDKRETCEHYHLPNPHIISAYSPRKP